ncbi:MAG: hypothetical protein H6822_09585 [Planctomycetaceae bacterium]|nr:hypothetical protein [Planctomycetales bacterium]MCB9922422.1 hypothetical protein [Planctomycetaceae bacterium]
MKNEAGVWIDHRKAVVVRISENGEDTRQINSDVVRPFAPAGGPSSKQPDRRQGYVAESTLEHTFVSQLKTFYDAVLTALRDADSVLIIGPGEAKGEFQKRLKSKNFPAHVVELEAADKVTNPQIVAHVREHFEAA